MALRTPLSSPVPEESSVLTKAVTRAATLLGLTQRQVAEALDIDKIPTLKPAFRKDGTVTAASSSSISDGAAALVVASESAAAAGGLRP